MVNTYLLSENGGQKIDNNVFKRRVKEQPNRLQVTGGYARQKTQMGERWNFRKLDDLLTPPTPEAPVARAAQPPGHIGLQYKDVK
jgi:hypothetical protein